MKGVLMGGCVALLCGCAVLDQIEIPDLPPAPVTVETNAPPVVTNTPPPPPVVPASKFAPHFGLPWFVYNFNTQLDSGAMERHLAYLGVECDERGIPRGNLVLSAEVHSDAGFSTVSGMDWKTHYRLRCQQAATAAKLIDGYGFGTAMIVWNSNTPGKGYKSMGWKPDKGFILAQAETLMRAVGWERTIWLPCSENDASTPSDIRDGLRKLPAKTGIPTWNVMNDSHPGSLKTVRIDTTSSDSWGIIKDMHEGSGTKYCTPKVSAYKRFMDLYDPGLAYTVCIGGDMVDGNEDRWEQILDYYAALHGYPNPPEPTQPTPGAILPANVTWLDGRGPNYRKAATVITLTSVSISGDRAKFKTASKIPWPERGSKNINAIGILIRKINGQFIGGKCEWCVGSRGWFDVRTNVEDGYNGHTLPAKGETVWIALGNPDNGSEISTIMEAVWP